MTTSSPSNTDSKKFFYVVGGEYSDLTFENLMTKTSQFKGPFESREKATEVWRKLSNQSHGEALVRYEIIEIFHKIDRMQLFGLAPSNSTSQEEGQAPLA